MYNKEIKIAIAAVLVIFGIYLITDSEIGWGITLIILAAVPILLIFRNEHLLLTFWHMRKQNVDAAETALLRIKNPDKLIRAQNAYYNLMMGLVESQKRSINKAEKFFRRAIDKGLSMKQNEAIAKLNLAMIMLSKRRKREATNLLNEAKKLDKYNMLSEQIKMVKQGMKRV